MARILAVLVALSALLHVGAAAAPRKSSTSSSSSTRPATSASASASSSYCPSGYRQSTTHVTATFDDVTGSPAGLGGPVPTPYYYLDYNAFGIVTVVPNPPAIGLIPNTNNSYAATGLRNQISSGTPMITTNYPNSTVGAFKLETFWFGCVVQDRTSNQLPSQCTLTITAYKGSDQTVSASQMIAAQTVTFLPSTITGASQLARFVVNPAFYGATFVTFQYTNAQPALTTLTGLIIDTVSTTVYNCS